MSQKAKQGSVSKMRAAVPEYQRLGGFTNRNLFLRVLGARMLRSGCQLGQGLGEGPLPGVQPFPGILTWLRNREL